MRTIGILSVLVLVGCATDSYIPKALHNPCSTGTPYGVACIDPSTLKPTVDPTHSGNGQIFNAWFNPGGNELDVTSDAFVWHKHNGSHAWAQLRNDLQVGKNYKYTIHNLTTKKDYDPDIMVDY